MKNTTPYRKKGNHSISSTDALLMDTSEMIESSSNDSNMSGENEKEPYDSHEDFMLIIIAVIGCMFPGVGFFITISITGTLVFHYRAGDFCQISVPFTVVIKRRASRITRCWQMSRSRAGEGRSMASQDTTGAVNRCSSSVSADLRRKTAGGSWSAGRRRSRGTALFGGDHHRRTGIP